MSETSVSGCICVSTSVVSARSGQSLIIHSLRHGKSASSEGTNSYGIFQETFHKEPMSSFKRYLQVVIC